MSAAPAEYPQIRPMFADALKAMAEGETEAEKQIVYVLNEARAALPCPSFVAAPAAHYRSLYVMLGGEAVRIIQVSSREEGRFHVWPGDSDTPFSAPAETLPLAEAVAKALKCTHSFIMKAAAEAYPASIEPPRKSPY